VATATQTATCSAAAAAPMAPTATSGCTCRTRACASITPIGCAITGRDLGDAPLVPVDLAVGNSFEDYRSGRDQVLETILEQER